MFRVSFCNKDSRSALMNVAKNLKDSSEYKNVFISRDLTKNKRDQIQQRRTIRNSNRRGGGNEEGENAIRPAGTPQIPLTGGNTVPLQTVTVSQSNSRPPAASALGDAFQ